MEGFWKLNAILLFIVIFTKAVFGQITTPAQAIFTNVPYGTDPQQLIDVYLPAGRNLTVSKVIVLIHGGGWSGGKKEDMNGWVQGLHNAFPQHVIANLGYRLGSISSPGFPKQIQDITAALQFLKSKGNEFAFSSKYALIGGSAGAHLSMLYGYGYDTDKDVRVICNLVGPSSLIDPSYINNRIYDTAVYTLLGNTSYAKNPQLFATVSPVSHITATSPKTISFYGDQDPLIPVTQGQILEDKLDSFGVYNKYYLYSGGGHGNWTNEQSAHMNKKINYFFNNYF